jgi:NAD(P)-dependent dehydrogenase (short-subunit alcohol dehydrogenase family)
MSQIALVTGGNRGLGRETCLRLAQAGMHVMSTARELEAAKDTADELGAELEQDSLEQGSLEPIELDVTDSASIARAVERVSRANGRLEVLVNNAGIALDGFDPDVARRTIAVNTHGAEHVTEAFLPLMADGGRIVMVSSESGSLSQFSDDLQQRFLDPSLDRARLQALLAEFIADVEAERCRQRGWPSSAYAVSKAGMNALTRILARENPRLHINAVSPGWARTRMGGSGATRSISEGAASIVWAAGHDVPTGGFFRDGRPLPW